MGIKANEKTFEQTILCEFFNNHIYNFHSNGIFSKLKCYISVKSADRTALYKRMMERNWESQSAKDEN